MYLEVYGSVEGARVRERRGRVVWMCVWRERESWSGVDALFGRVMGRGPVGSAAFELLEMTENETLDTPVSARPAGVKAKGDEMGKESRRRGWKGVVSWASPWIRHLSWHVNSREYGTWQTCQNCRRDSKEFASPESQKQSETWAKRVGKTTYSTSPVLVYIRYRSVDRARARVAERRGRVFGFELGASLRRLDAQAVVHPGLRSDGSIEMARNDAPTSVELGTAWRTLKTCRWITPPDGKWNTTVKETRNWRPK
ncbi:hypothetical protein FPV67DRAFT_1446873 [Lyophyllum atratum]|nr:hypothetical protein FPV67DRAFT_1446873 [Lyophyllum atratum]